MRVPNGFVLSIIVLSPAMTASLPAQTPAPVFEVATVKPSPAGGRGMGIRTQPGGRVTTQNTPLHFLIQFAYRVRSFQVTGGPSWLDTERWDVNAKAETGFTREQMPDMLQALLIDRFKLQFHRETKESPVYNLVAAKGGMKLSEPKEGGCVTFNPNTPPPAAGEPMPNFCGNMMIAPGGFNAYKIGMQQLIMFLSDITGRTVIDKTGFTGTFDVHMQFARDEATAGMRPPGDGPPPSPGDTSRPSIFTALQETLGLRLDAAKAPVELLVVDHAERPDAN